MKKQQGNLPMAIMMVIIFIAIIGIAGYFVYQKSLGTAENEPVACTMDAKICPDGTSVGRVAPDCEFAPCPEDAKANWQVYKNEQYGVEIKYPQNFWAAQNLQITQKDCNYDFSTDECPNAKNIIKSELEADGLDLANVSVTGTKKIYGSNLFCLYGYSEGAAGTYYSNEYYVLSSNKKCTIIKIVTPYPNCQNYLPLEPGNTEQEKSYNNCLASNQEKPKILEQVLSTFNFLQN